MNRAATSRLQIPGSWVESWFEKQTGNMAALRFHTQTGIKSITGDTNFGDHLLRRLCRELKTVTADEQLPNHHMWTELGDRAKAKARQVSRRCGFTHPQRGSQASCPCMSASSVPRASKPAALNESFSSSPGFLEREPYCEENL